MATNKTQQILLQIIHDQYCYKLNTTNIATNKTQQIWQQIKHNTYC